MRERIPDRVRDSAAGRRRRRSGAGEKTGPGGRHSPHGRRPSRSAGHLRSRHADAARAARRLAAGADRRGGEEARDSRSPQRSDNLNAPIDGQPRGAAERRRRHRRARTATSAATTTSGSIPARTTRWSTARSARRCSIDPPDGRVPPLTAGATARAAPARSAGRPPTRRRAKTIRASRGRTPTTTRRCVRSPSAACVGFSSTSGPPILPTYFYNNLHQIVQTPDHVMILTEMVHDARVVRIERTASAADDPQMARRLDRPLGRRHARRRDDELHRQDALPRIVARTCTSSSASRASTPERCAISSRSRIRRRGRGRGRLNTRGRSPTTCMYEYACHEGNYAMGNILRGARLKEKNEAAAKKSKQQ